MGTMTKVLGIDLGGTKIKAVLYEFEGAEAGAGAGEWGAPSGSEAREFKVLREEKILTRAERGLPEVYKDLENLVESFLEDGVKAVGIGVPGPVPSDGVPLKMPNIPDSENFDITGKLEQKTKLSVFISNDANCFLAGEKFFGVGRNYENLLGITMGTGIGGAVFVNGEFLIGKDGAVGEFGHIILDKKNNLSFENLCSGSAISRRFKETNGKEMCAKEIHEAAINGDPAALDLYTKVGHDFGIGILNLIFCFNPEIIILGGATSRAFPFMKASMRKVLDSQGFSRANSIKIIRSELESPGTLGAAYFALCRPFST